MQRHDSISRHARASNHADAAGRHRRDGAMVRDCQPDQPEPEEQAMNKRLNRAAGDLALYASGIVLGVVASWAMVRYVQWKGMVMW